MYLLQCSFYRLKSERLLGFIIQLLQTLALEKDLSSTDLLFLLYRKNHNERIYIMALHRRIELILLISILGSQRGVHTKSFFFFNPVLYFCFYLRENIFFRSSQQKFKYFLFLGFLIFCLFKLSLFQRVFLGEHKWQTNCCFLFH